MPLPGEPVGTRAPHPRRASGMAQGGGAAASVAGGRRGRARRPGRATRAVPESGGSQGSCLVLGGSPKDEDGRARRPRTRSTTWAGVPRSAGRVDRVLPVEAADDGLEVQDGELLVARLWQWSEARIRKDAEQHREERALLATEDGKVVEEPVYAVSAFAALKSHDENVEALMRRVCDLAFGYRRATWVAFSTQAELAEHNIDTILREPPPGHHDLVLGTTLRTEDIAALHSIFQRRPRRRFPSCQA